MPDESPSERKSLKEGVVNSERRGPIYDLSKEKREKTGSSSGLEILTSQL